EGAAGGGLQSCMSMAMGVDADDLAVDGDRQGGQRLSRLAAGLPAGRSRLSWCIKTVSLGREGDEQRGAVSPLSGRRSSHQSLGTERRMSPLEVEDSLTASRSSLCSMKGDGPSPNRDRALCMLFGDGESYLFALFDGHGHGGHLVSLACSEALPKMFLQALTNQGTEAAAAPPAPAAESPQNPQDAGTDTLPPCRDLLRISLCDSFLQMQAYLE
ncbi:unnamed protein product, partial [Prorocentrum cordatum]